MTKSSTLFLYLSRFIKAYKSTFIVAIAIGLLAHMYAFTNKIINWDDITHLYDLGWTISHGRWGLSLLSFILPSYSIPWFNGIVSLIIISLSGLLIIDTLHIRRRIYQYSIVALLVTFPSLTVTYTFMFTSLAYSISFISSILPIWLLQKFSIKRLIASTVLLAFSLSIYQAYITCSGVLIILIILNAALSGESVKKIYTNISIHFIFLALSLALYFIANQIIQIYYDIPFGDYAQSALDQKESLGIKFRIVLFSIINEIFFHKHCLLPTILTMWMFIGAFCCSILIFILWLIKSTSSRLIKTTAIICIVLMPICVNSIYLLVDSYHIHSLVLYSFVFLLFTPIVIFNTIENTVLFPIKATGITFLSIVLLQYIYFANNTYLYLDLQYRQLYASSIRLSNDIQQFMYADGENCDVVILGRLCASNSEDNPIRKVFHYSNNDNTVSSLNILILDGITLEIFIHNYVDATIPFTSCLKRETIEDSEEYKNMESYPSKNSIKKIDNYIVVKLNENSESE